MKSTLLRLGLILGLVLSAACSTIDTSEAPRLQAEATWAILPFANNTETPMAGNRAEAIAEALLRSQGIPHVQRYPAELQQDALFATGERKDPADALAWARQAGARYALTGSVDEWRYKVGVDGEAAVGVVLSIVDVESGRAVWSGSGAQSGWSREALSGVAQRLLRRLLGAGLSGRTN